MTTLTRANNQWSNRAPDERYNSIELMHKAALATRTHSQETERTMSHLRTYDSDGSVVISDGTATYDLTNWSFDQVSRRAKAPAAYLRTLPALLASRCINNGLDQLPLEEREKPISLLTKHNGSALLRAVTSDRYSRIWNADITDRLVQLKIRGPWQEAPAAFDGSRGQYLSDRNMFSFFVDNERRIFERDKNGGLSRGFFVWNSEVGSDSFGIMTFLYEFVCGNHRVWGASEIRELRIRHIGDADDRYFDAMRVRLVEYAESSATEDELKIQSCRDYTIAGDKDEVIDLVFNTTGRIVPRKTITKAYELAEQHEDWYGSPRSAWGMSGGLTQIARDLPNADDRVSLDRLSTKVMELAIN